MPKKSAEPGAVKKAAKKSAAKNAADTRGGGQFANVKIRKEKDKWPNRENTLIHKSYLVIRNGMTYEQYKAAGGRYIDLVDMLKQSIVSTSPA